MRVNLNREKLTRVHEMVTLLLNDYPAGDAAEKLIDALINKVRLKMRNKLDKMSFKNCYSFSIPQEEAMALFIWFGQMEAVVQPTDYIFEKNVLQDIINQIDREYGTINRTGEVDRSVQRTIS
ncbi:hypothetical protein ACVWYG_002559 [Pedobacter sp. UYEF25]